MTCLLAPLLMNATVSLQQSDTVKMSGTCSLLMQCPGTISTIMLSEASHNIVEAELRETHDSSGEQG